MDTVGALVAILAADPNVAAAVHAVYGDELPEAEAANMPRANVVVRYAGGGALGGAEKRWSDGRIDVDTYGATPKEAGDVYRLVRTALAGIDRVTKTVDGVDVLVHWAQESQRAFTGREPDTHWPTCLGSWQVLAGEGGT